MFHDNEYPNRLVIRTHFIIMIELVQLSIERHLPAYANRQISKKKILEFVDNCIGGIISFRGMVPLGGGVKMGNKDVGFLANKNVTLPGCSPPTWRLFLIQ